jgi:hypothetical protein
LSSNYAGLARDLDLPEKEFSDPSAAMIAIKKWLEKNTSWLIIFDNAQEPDDVAPFIPSSGKGNVIITSRNPNWGSPSEVIPVDVFIREESVQFLLKRTGRNDPDAAASLA